MLLLYLVLGLILALGWLAVRISPNQGPNFLAEALGIVVTVGIIDVLLRRQNRLNWLTARLDARGRLLRDATDAAEVLDSLPPTDSESPDWDEHRAFDVWPPSRIPDVVSAKEVYQSRIENATPAVRSAALHRIQRLDSRLAFEVTHSSVFLSPEVLAAVIRLRATIDQALHGDHAQPHDALSSIVRLEAVLDPLLEFISVVGSPEVKLRVEDDAGVVDGLFLPRWLENIGVILDIPGRLIRRLAQWWKVRSRW